METLAVFDENIILNLCVFVIYRPINEGAPLATRRGLDALFTRAALLDSMEFLEGIGIGYFAAVNDPVKSLSADVHHFWLWPGVLGADPIRSGLL